MALLFLGPAEPKLFSATVVQSPSDLSGWAALSGKESLSPELLGTDKYFLFG